MASYMAYQWFFDYPLSEISPDCFKFPDNGLYAGESLNFTRDSAQKATQVEAASVISSAGIWMAKTARHSGSSPGGRSS